MISAAVCPWTELDTSIGIDTIAHADNHVEIVESKVPFNFSFAFRLNCCKKRNSWILIQFSRLEDILDMPRNGGFVTLEQFSHLFEGQPYGLIL